MKTIHYIYTALTSVAMAVAFQACTPDKYDMGGRGVSSDDLVEGLAYTITHDTQNPNIVYLKSLMDRHYTSLWEHPQGRSQKADDTLKIAFPGTYNVVYGVMTPGGPVYGDTAHFTIDQFYAGFVSDKSWTMLTGGVDQAKTWIPDNGKYGMAKGEISYADPSTTVEYDNFSTNWDPDAGYTDATKEYMQSEMTFDLKGAANVEVKTAHDGKVEVKKGTFMLNLDNMTITFTDAELLHTNGWTKMTSNWKSGLKILKLTDNQLQVGILREKASSGEDPWWIIWNFVSKDYADNYVPEDQPDPVPSIDGDANTVMTTSNSKTWTLSTDSPYDWADLDGNLLNNFSKPADYQSTGWAAYDAKMAAGTSFKFTATSADGGRFTFQSYDGGKVEGTYTVDKNHDITFSEDLSAKISETPYTGWTSTMMLETASRKLRLLKTQTDVFGSVSDMWLGKRSTEKSEYTVYHFVLGGGSGSTVDADEVRKDYLTGGSARTWKVDVQHIPATWATDHVYDNITDGKRENYSSCTMPEWSGFNYSESDIAACGKFRLTFHKDGTLGVILADGTPVSSTWTYCKPDDYYGMPLVKFPAGLDLNFMLDGDAGAWLNFTTQTPPATTGMPDSQFLELYDFDLDANGNVTGVWLGMDNGHSTEGVSDSNPDPANWLKTLSNQRKVMHLVIDDSSNAKYHKIRRISRR